MIEMMMFTLNIIFATRTEKRRCKVWPAVSKTVQQWTIGPRVVEMSSESSMAKSHMSVSRET